jgi:EAL domain-containing protein (putative c-di-GMP-specific phosphodiesterase class I)/CHASE2 domain-containing sensor protein
MAIRLKKTKMIRKMTVISVIIAFLSAMGTFQPIDLILNTLQWKINPQPVSGAHIVVGIDSQSINTIGRWPWPRSKQAELLQSLDEYQAKEIYVDIGYQGATAAQEDTSLAKTLANMKTPTSVISLTSTDPKGNVKIIRSNNAIVGSTPQVSSDTPYLFSYVWNMPITVNTPNGKQTSLSADMAKLKTTESGYYRLNYNFDPTSITAIPAAEIISKKASPHKVAGKSVIVSVTDLTQKDAHFMPGHGLVAGALFHIIGAETLMQGIPIDIGWIGFFILACVTASCFLCEFGLKHYKAITTLACLVTLTTSSVMTVYHISNDPVPSIILSLSLAIYIGRKKLTLQQSTRDNKTGIHNINGYESNDLFSNMFFVCASAEIIRPNNTYLSADETTEIWQKIGQRLLSVIDEQQLKTNEQHQFIWEMPATHTDILSQHLSGIRSLFNQPIMIGAIPIRIDIYFGVDRSVSNSIEVRTTNACTTSRSAAEEKITFKISTDISFEQTFETNFQRELSDAADNDSIEFLIEGRRDLGNAQIMSASLSMRWIHPAHGDISNEKIINLARQTHCLCWASLLLVQRAAAYAKTMRQYNPEITLSIKLPIEILNERSFITSLQDLITANQCEPNSIIIELTDLTLSQAKPKIIQAIKRYQKMGFKIALGSFGTNDEDLKLLAIAKPNQIILSTDCTENLFASIGKQAFTLAMLHIADASDVTTVAQDIQNEALLQKLKATKCHQAQGKIISLPMNLTDFLALISPIKAAKMG